VLFAYPGVSIKTRFEGTSIDAELVEYGSGTPSNTNYFNAIIDGGIPTIVRLSKSQQRYTIASGLTNGIHTLELFKRTESNVGIVAFKGLWLDKGKKLKALDSLPKRKIEFIGNSITCGYGNELSTDSPQIHHFTSANENNYKAWGAVAARSLHAEYSCVAYSGRGLYQNNSGSKIGTLPMMYDQIIADDPSATWNHLNYIPNVIVINLGTNDFSAEVVSSNYIVDSAVFVKTYISFLAKLRAYYPHTSIVCCVGVMMSDMYPSGTKAWTRIQNYVSAVRTYENDHGDANVYYLKLEPQTGPYYGEDWHPSAAEDSIMAQALVGFIEKNLNWENSRK
jgi:lysophospholipase L1-like esterase